MQKYIVTSLDEGQTLEKYVRKVLKEAPLSFIYKLFRKKDVRVNNHWQDNKFIIHENDEISIYVTDEQLDEFKSKFDIVPSDEISSWIIYEDKNLLIINKPRGILVQKDESNDKALDQMVIEYLMFKNEYDPINNKGYKPGPIHRLDRNTSGIILFGKNHDALNYFSSLMQDHKLIDKHYTSLVVGNFDKDEGLINAPLRKNFDHKKVVVAPISAGAKEALTHYKVITRYKDYTLLDLTLRTGRTHQIRVHMSFIRHHVVGDTKYGDFKVNNYFEKEYGFKNQFLHACKIKFGELNKKYAYLSNKEFLAPLPLEMSQILDKIEK